MFSFNHSRSRPLGLEWRASSWTITAVVGLGITVDLLVYSIIIPVMPFQFEKLGYNNISALTGWLLFAYSAGLVLATIPIAMFSERYNARRWPLIVGLVLLTGSQIMLMEAPTYAVMCGSRVIQGVGSSMVWVVGLALLCDSAPPELVGSQLGIAMGGVSIGLLVGPSVGGALFTKFGFRGPFIFSISTTVVDLIGRLLIIERSEALLWGYDPAMTKKPMEFPLENPRAIDVPGEGTEAPLAVASLQNIHAVEADARAEVLPQVQISLISVLSRLVKSSRALAAIFIIFVYGVVYSSQEPVLPLHLQHVWNLDSRMVGFVFIAAAVPTLFASPISGWLSDKKDPEWSSAIFLLLALPWWGIIIIEYKLALFISLFALENFFTSAVLTPLTAELASVADGIEGIGYGHVYGAFNLVFGVGSALGPLIGGQVYGQVVKGWMTVCLISLSMLVLCLGVSVYWVGKRPLYGRFLSLNTEGHEN